MLTDLENFTIADAAFFLRVSTDTLRRWEREGRLSCTRTPGGHRRYRRADLEALLTDEPGETVQTS